MNDIQVTDYLTWEYSQDPEIQYLNCPPPTPMRNYMPQWFKDLPFDDGLMETTVIDEKLENLIGVLEWDISSTRSDNTFSKLFDFE